MQNLSSLKHYGYHFFRLDEIILNNPRVPKSWKSWILSFPSRCGSQTTLQKPQSAAPTRNLQITCRGEATSVSNTPPGQKPPRHPADFRGISTMFCKYFLKSVNSFQKSLEFRWERTFKRAACKISARLKYSGYYFSWGNEIIMNSPGGTRIMKIMNSVIFRPLLLSDHRLKALERCANAQSSNNLQRRGFDLCK